MDYATSMKIFRRIFLVFLFLLVVAFFGLAPAIVETRLNRLVSASTIPVSAEARELHSSLRIVDLHADSLLWGRNLVQSGTRGHVDVPRLIAGNVALEVFTAVTKSPRGLNYERNDDKSDTIFWLGIAQRWPLRTWNSLTNRALFRASRFDETVRDSHGRLVAIRTA